MESIPFNEARRNLSSLINQIQVQPITISRHGTPAAVVISPSRYEEFLSGLQKLEDLEDLALIEASLKDPSPSIPWEQVKKELGNEI